MQTFIRAAAVAAVAVALTAIAGSAEAQECKAAAAASPADTLQMLRAAQPMRGGIMRPSADIAAKPNPVPSVFDGAGPGQTSDGVPITTQNYGQNNFETIYHYSDMRVNQYAVTSYPFSAVGKLSFVRKGRAYECSAALIARSILVTAGHCVFDDNTVGSRKWNTSGVFTPAYNGSAPFGSATVAHWCTSGNWYANGRYFDGNDVAVVVLNKKTGDSNEIGYYTGTFGFCWENCAWKYNSLTQLGYPANYDGGAYMQMGQHIETFPYANGADHADDYGFGSGMQGGSSGGPHIANLGDLSDSASNTGQFGSRNIIFAVTSWGVESGKPQLKIQGASPLSGPNNTNAFRFLYNDACKKARTLHGKPACGLL